MKNKKHNKKAELLEETTVKIVIAVVIIVILGYAILKAYKLLNESNDQEKMKKQIEKLHFNIREVNEKGSERIVEVILKPGWFMRTFLRNDYPEGECRKAIGCLCICEDYLCSETKVCEGFDFDVKIDEGKFNVDSIYFDKALSNIVIFKENNIVKLKEVK